MSEVTTRATRLRLTLTAASVAIVSLPTSRARAQSIAHPDSVPPADLALSQYQHDRWTTVDGLPNHAVDWIVQSPDGYLWLGTEGGLVRFDGVRFTAFDRSNTAALRESNHYPTVPLHVDRKGVLWIGASSGLVRYTDGEFTRAAATAQPAAPNITRMVEDRAGRLWGWEQDIDGRMYEVRGGRPVDPDPQSGLPSQVTAVAADRNGDVWVATVERGLLRVHDGRAVSALPSGGMPDGVTTLYVSRDSVAWIGTQRGFGRLQHGRFEFRPLGAGGLAGYVTAFAEDEAGNVWLGTVGMGVLRWRAGGLERFDRRDGLSRNQVTSLFIDREGSVWVGTRGGLDRLRRAAVATFTPTNGGPEFADPGALLWDPRGRFIVAGASTGLAAGQVGAWTPLAGAAAEENRKIWTLAQGRDGVWVGADYALTLYRATAAPRVYTALDGLAGKWVLAVAEDSLERVWVGTDQGLFRLEQGRFRAFTSADGLPHAYVRALIVDRRGAVWAGTNGGLAQVVGDSVHSWGPADGLAGPFVFAIREIRDGSIWIGTSGGLTRVRDGRLVSIRAEHGLPGELVAGIEATGDDLWIVTGSGISRVALSELHAVADGRAPRVHATTFGTQDGLPATEVVAGAQPLSAQTPDGRLWFSTAGGLAVVDPRRVPQNAIAPVVHIEEVRADSVPLTGRPTAATPMRVPVRTRRLTVRYTATSLLVPDRVRFRYQLVGYDPVWAEPPSAERVVSYTNLQPGRYTFRVIAANDAGVWNLDGAAFHFTVPPAFYQMVWFRTLCIAGLVALLLTLHRARVRQLERRAEERKRADESLAKLRAELAHATRTSSLATLTASIAHEVKQPLSGIVTNASTCQRMLAREPPDLSGAREAVRRLIRDGNRADAVVTRVRALFARKPLAAEPLDLNEAVREVIKLSQTELARVGAALRVELTEDLPRVMGDRVQLQQVIINLLRNACEAMHDVGGGKREIVIATGRDVYGGDGERVCLSIRDSGVGVEPHAAKKLFDPFYSTKPDGMGIGLSVSRSIIENHHGRLWAVPNDGPGTTFAFSIPIGPRHVQEKGGWNDDGSAPADADQAARNP